MQSWTYPKTMQNVHTEILQSVDDRSNMLIRMLNNKFTFTNDRYSLQNDAWSFTPNLFYAHNCFNQGHDCKHEIKTVIKNITIVSSIMYANQVNFEDKHQTLISP